MAKFCFEINFMFLSSIATSSEETQYCLHVLEIISLMFREQDPKHLASANFQRSKDEKRQDEQALAKVFFFFFDCF